MSGLTRRHAVFGTIAASRWRSTFKGEPARIRRTNTSDILKSASNWNGERPTRSAETERPENKDWRRDHVLLCLLEQVRPVLKKHRFAPKASCHVPGTNTADLSLYRQLLVILSLFLDETIENSQEGAPSAGNSPASRKHLASRSTGRCGKMFLFGKMPELGMPP